MSAVALVLSLVLTQAATPCKGERLVLVPFDTVALPRTETRALEDAVRKAVAAMPGVCLEERSETVARLRTLGPGAAACDGAACLGARGVAPGAAWIVRGVALGVGGSRSVVLALEDARDWEGRETFQLSVARVEPGEAEARARQSFQALWSGRPSERGVSLTEVGSSVKRPTRMWPKVMLAAGGAALVAGVGFGLASRRAESRLSSGNADCAGEGEAFRACLDGRIRDGRRQATTANVLLGAGALLGAGGTFFLVWELP